MTACGVCKSRDTQVFGCINNQDEYSTNGIQIGAICLYCCGCDEHEEYWASLCCYDKNNGGFTNIDLDCQCCTNKCPKCQGE